MVLPQNATCSTWPLHPACRARCKRALCGIIHGGGRARSLLQLAFRRHRELVLATAHFGFRASACPTPLADPSTELPRSRPPRRSDAPAAFFAAETSSGKSWSFSACLIKFCSPRRTVPSVFVPCNSSILSCGEMWRRCPCDGSARNGLGTTAPDPDAAPNRAERRKPTANRPQVSSGIRCFEHCLADSDETWEVDLARKRQDLGRNRPTQGRN